VAAAPATTPTSARRRTERREAIGVFRHTAHAAREPTATASAIPSTSDRLARRYATRPIPPASGSSANHTREGTDLIKIPGNGGGNLIAGCHELSMIKARRAAGASPFAPSPPRHTSPSLPQLARNGWAPRKPGASGTLVPPPQRAQTRRRAGDPVPAGLFSFAPSGAGRTEPEFGPQAQQGWGPFYFSCRGDAQGSPAGLPRVGPARPAFRVFRSHPLHPGSALSYQRSLISSNGHPASSIQLSVISGQLK